MASLRRVRGSLDRCKTNRFVERIALPFTLPFPRPPLFSSVHVEILVCFFCLVLILVIIIVIIIIIHHFLVLEFPSLQPHELLSIFFRGTERGVHRGTRDPACSPATLKRAGPSSAGLQAPTRTAPESEARTAEPRTVPGPGELMGSSISGAGGRAIRGLGGDGGDGLRLA